VTSNPPLAKHQTWFSQGDAEGSHFKDPAREGLNRRHFPICNAVRHLGQRIEGYGGILRETTWEVTSNGSNVRVSRADAVARTQAIWVLFINIDKFGAKLVAKQLLRAFGKGFFDFVVTVGSLAIEELHFRDRGLNHFGFDDRPTGLELRVGHLFKAHFVEGVG